MQTCRNAMRMMVLLAALAAPAAATTLVRMNLDELTRSAALVVRVRCEGAQAGEARGEIWTYTRFTVLETLKGTAPATLTVRLLGGRVGHRRARVEGVPEFERGEEAYLFLEPAVGGEWTVTSWVQGTFRVREASTPRESVTQDTGDVTEFDPATREFRRGALRMLPVEQFRRMVQDAVQRSVVKEAR